MNTPAPAPELAELAARVQTDLEGAGFPPPNLYAGDQEQGGAMVYTEAGDVHVNWLAHGRLHNAALDALDADRIDDPAVRLYEDVQTAMHTALGAILRAFGHRISVTHHTIPGYIVRPSTQVSSPGRIDSGAAS